MVSEAGLISLNTSWWKRRKFVQTLNNSFNVQNGENMSDNEAEPEGNPPGALAGAEEQTVIAQPQVVLPNIRPVANFQVTPPEKFSFKPEDWPKWIQRFERFHKATGLD